MWWLGLKSVGLNRAAWMCGSDFGGFKSVFLNGYGLLQVWMWWLGLIDATAGFDRC